jgi:hypothetical protein
VVDTALGPVPRASTELRLADHLGSWRRRWGIGRMSCRVEPGLYALGGPNPESPVLVTANYKMTFDRLRSKLGGVDAWVLVLDTQGINVWCAAGKGTFGTGEVIRQVEATRLAHVVCHRVLLLPQLGATGVAAHQVQEATGFRVVYGPVRARDIRAFLAAGCQATPEMRRVTFTLWERLVVVPMELVGGAKFSLVVLALLFVLAGVGRHGFSAEASWTLGVPAAGLYLVGFLAGALVTPVLLPWLPGRAFALKGAAVGGALALVHLLCQSKGLTSAAGALDAGAWLFLLPAVSSFFAMNFTGATPYTSPSGVRREVRVALPGQVLAAALGLALWLISHLV